MAQQQRPNEPVLGREERVAGLRDHLGHVTVQRVVLVRRQRTGRPFDPDPAQLGQSLHVLVSGGAVPDAVEVVDGTGPVTDNGSQVAAQQMRHRTTWTRGRPLAVWTGPPPGRS